jgi:hypothetical protein
VSPESRRGISQDRGVIRLYFIKCLLFPELTRETKIPRPKMLGVRRPDSVSRESRTPREMVASLETASKRLERDQRRPEIVPGVSREGRGVLRLRRPEIVSSVLRESKEFRDSRRSWRLEIVADHSSDAHTSRRSPAILRSQRHTGLQHAPEISRDAAVSRRRSDPSRDCASPPAPSRSVSGLWGLGRASRRRLEIHASWRRLKIKK